MACAPKRGAMAFNRDRGKPYHGSAAVSEGKLTGSTDTDYFYFFCPRCGDRHIMRVLDYELRYEGAAESYPDERPRQAKDFIIALQLHCRDCKLTDFVKIGSIGWQGGRLPE
jgi:hypothetical protein